MTGSEQPMGVVLREDGRLGLRYERTLRQAPEKVWRAITESEHLRHWLPADIVGERRDGADIELPFWPAHVERYQIDEPVLRGKIQVWQPHSVFEWTWQTDLLRFELERAAEGTLLTFTTWLGEDNAEMAANAAAGYHVCLDQLVELLDTGAARPLVDVDVKPWELRYVEAVGAVD